MSVCDVPVIAEVCNTVGEGTASLIAAPFDWLAQAMGSAAAWLFESVWAAYDSTTLVDLTDPAYIDVYNVLFGVAVFVTLVFFCLQLISGLVHRDPTALSRAALGVAKSVLGSFVIITITGLLLEITDQLTIGVVTASGNTMKGMGDRIALLPAGLTALNVGSPGVGAIVTIFLSALAISAAAIVWFSLLIRKALLLVAIVFGPIALAGATWDAAKGWFSKWVAFVIALILSKLVLVVIFLVAVAQVSAPIDADLASVSDPIAGIVLMFIAAFAPYITYKFLNFVGLDMYHAMSSEQEAKSAMNRPVPVPNSPMTEGAKKILGPSSDGGSGSAPRGGSAAAPASGGRGLGPVSSGGGPGAAAAAGAGAGSSATTGTAGVSAGAGVATAGVAVGAAVASAAVTAGPKVGGAVGQTAEAHTQSAGDAVPPSASQLASAPSRAPLPSPDAAQTVG
ncbi:conjugal transfer protein TrbL [Cryobacterium algoritolerans]|uniref:Conjugal transfer protein TrbL n=1 Tax=Cryobacterium algoritolerans TaxID=1259184 RepID=A0A4R8WV99_9MICO|nr:conjugal transfer protein TrbL [Cryobacterium algoritolerans]TFC15211.1 conjugal transfer protein TrbL [Cryobacterium algoritolerans]